MPVDILLTASVELLILGMGAVFIILGLLIGCMTMLCRWAPSEDAANKSCQAEKHIIAAIQSAIHQYRSQHTQKTTV